MMGPGTVEPSADTPDLEFTDGMKSYLESSITEIDNLLVTAAIENDKDIVIALSTALIQVKKEYAAAVAKYATDEVAFMSAKSLRRAKVLRTVLKDRDLYLDSACTSHLFHSDMLPGTMNRRNLVPPRIFGGVGGAIRSDIMADGKYVKNIHFSPDTPKNLISFGQLREDGYIMSIDDVDGTVLATKDSIQLQFVQDDSKLFPLKQIVYLSDPDEAAQYQNRSIPDFDLEKAFASQQSFTRDQRERADKARRWHAALGHMGNNAMKESIRRGNQNRAGITWKDLELAEAILGPCEVCIRAKATAPRLTKPTHESTTIIGHTQHVDALYFRDAISKLRTLFMFVDEATNKTCVQLGSSKSKSEFADAVKNVSGFYTRCGHSPIKLIYSDNERSVVAFEAEFNMQGGQIIFKAPGQHDGLAERYIRVFKDILRTLLFQLDYTWPVDYFEDLVHEVVQLMDLRDSPKTNGVPVGEVVKGVRPDYAFMDVPFGAYGLATNTRNELKKDDQPRAVYGLILRRSYGPEMRYKVLPLDKSMPNAQPFFCKKFQELPIPPDVIDHLNAMSDGNLTPDTYFDSTLRGVDVETDINQLSDEQIRRMATENPDAFAQLEPVFVPIAVRPSQYTSVSPAPPSHQVEIPHSFEAGPPAPDSAAQTPMIPQSEPVPASPSPTPRRVFKRVDPALRDAPAVKARDDPGLGRGMRSQRKSSKSPAEEIAEALFISGVEYDTYVQIFESAFIAKVGANMSYKKASEKHGSAAYDAGEKEMATMLSKEIFTPVFWNSLTEDLKKKTIRSFTFYKEKFHKDGSLDRIKARMVANGSTVDKSNLGDISSPTPGLEALFLLHALAAQFGWGISVMDIPFAFLHSRLPERQRIPMIISKEETAIIIKLKPEWKKYVRKDGTLVVMLIGSIYGMPESPMLFNDDLSAAMLSIGYVQTESDKCVFVKSVNDNISIVLIHVDDLAHFYTDQKFQTDLFNMISRVFTEPTLKDGDEGIHLGIEYAYDRQDRSVRLTMIKYVDKILADFDIQRGAPTPTTAEFLSVDESSPKYDQRKYASALMSIFYLAQRTRRDLLFPLIWLATRVQDARQQDADKLERVFRFLFATRKRGLVLRTRGTRLVISIDASYAIHGNSRSHTGIYVTLGGLDTDAQYPGGCIWARSSVQRLVATSSFEAELNALHTARDLIEFLRSLMSEFGFDQVEPSLVLEDNMALIQSVAQGERFRGRSTHINVRVHAFAQMIEAGVVELTYCPTEIQLADPLTKPMPSRSQLYLLVSLLHEYGILLEDAYDTAVSTVLDDTD
jgi:hypothetical protein